MEKVLDRMDAVDFESFLGEDSGLHCYRGRIANEPEYFSPFISSSSSLVFRIQSHYKAS